MSGQGELEQIREQALRNQSFFNKSRNATEQNWIQENYGILDSDPSQDIVSII